MKRKAGVWFPVLSPTLSRAAGPGTGGRAPAPLVAAHRRAGLANATGTGGRRHGLHHSTEDHGRAFEAP